MESTMRQRYAWVVSLMSSFTDIWIIRIVISLASFSMALAAAMEIGFGYQAKTTVAFGVQITAAIFALLAGIGWLVGRWPGLTVMFWFIIVSDVAIFASIFTVDVPPEIALGKTAFVIPLGLLAGFFLTNWMFVAFLVVAAAGVSAVAVWAATAGGVSVTLAVVVWQPVIVATVAVPVLLYLLVRSLRVDLNGQD